MSPLLEDVQHVVDDGHILLPDQFLSIESSVVDRYGHILYPPSDSEIHAVSLFFFSSDEFLKI